MRRLSLCDSGCHRDEYDVNEAGFCPRCAAIIELGTRGAWRKLRQQRKRPGRRAREKNRAR